MVIDIGQWTQDVWLYLVDQWSKGIFNTDICLIVPHWVDGFLFLLTSVERGVAVVLLDENVGITGAASVHGYQLPAAKE